MKLCIKCILEKDLYMFPKKGNICKSCKSIYNNNYSKKYREENKEILSEYKKRYYEENKEEISIKSREYREENKDAIKLMKKRYYEENKEEMLIKSKEYYEENREQLFEYSKKYREENKEEISIKSKEYYEENKEEMLIKSKEYYEENKEEISIKNKKYREENKEKISIRHKKYREKNKEKLYENFKNRLKSDIIFKISFISRNMIGRSFRRAGYSKNSKTSEILGCSFEEFKLHLESKFEDWMNWENRGLYNGELNYGWDIDHIIPLSSSVTEEDVIRLNHYINLQPLCSHINRDIKRDNY